MSSNSVSLAGFRVVQIKFCKSSNATHCLYLKEHNVREKCPEKPLHRTLFIIGVPPFCTKEALKNVFSHCGNVQQVYIHKKPTLSEQTETYSFFSQEYTIKGFKVAYVVFENYSGLEAALKLDSAEPLVLSTDTDKVFTGLKKWIVEYNKSIPDQEELEREVDGYMRVYDERMAKLQEQTPSETEDDGWVTVTGKGRNPGFARKESVEQKIMAKERKKSSKKELLNFYRFQIKESKMNHLMGLREKFEEDKKKVELLKKTRRFKPF